LESTETPSGSLVEEEIHRVVEGGELRIEFQPVFDLSDWLIGEKRIVGAEALARFESSSRPEQVFGQAVALDPGLGVDLNLAAAEHALRHLPLLPDDTYLSINVSPAAVVSPKLLVLLARVPPQRIMIEVSEQATWDTSHDVKGALAALRSDGFRLAIDNVGAGLASLSRLISIPHDILKLDKKVVRDINDDETRRAIAKALCALAAATGAVVVAEAIESTQELMTLVDEVAVRYGQGFALAKPAPIPEWN
jgi:EAL domain-containing protein (putative c-di-GMP-specific phosphodiesterase class I)